MGRVSLPSSIADAQVLGSGVGVGVLGGVGIACGVGTEIGGLRSLVFPAQEIARARTNPALVICR